MTAQDHQRIFTRSCDACGTYEITSQAEPYLREDSTVRRSRGRLSAATRRASDEGKQLTLTRELIKEILENSAATSLSAKQRLFVRLLRDRLEHFGDQTFLDASKDWPLVEAATIAEFEALAPDLRRRGLVGHVQDVLDSDPSHGWTLTSEGWQLVEPIGGGVKGLGFVAMSFREDLNEPFENGIRPAIEADCGLTAIRVDKEHFSEKICDRIIADIRRCEFAVADFTHHRGGVYFEAGSALALGKPVIWMCREDHSKDVHFDTRQYPHIFWKGPEDLRNQLRDRIRALILGARLE